MKQLILLLGILLGYSTISNAQRDDIPLQSERRAFAEKSIHQLKDGAMVVRLKTNHRKISMLKATLRSSKITAKQRKRHEKILGNTIATRDAINRAIMDMFLDSFSFCPVYVMYDTSSRALARGVRKGIFLNQDYEVDPTVELKEPHVFLANYRKQSGEFPFDVLIMRKLEEKLDEPFPYFVQLRESWINNINTPGAARAVVNLDRRLRKFYALTLEREEKRAQRKAKKKS